MYRIQEHTADIRLIVEEDSFEGLLCCALEGMNDVLSPAGIVSKPSNSDDISLESPDRTGLCIDFLNECLSLSMLHLVVYLQVEFDLVSECALIADMRGFSVESFQQEIKAVTYHEADVKKSKDGKWQTTIVFDL